MRTFVAAIALIALAACGQSSSTAPSAPQATTSATPGSAEWAQSFGASPRVVSSYDMATVGKNGAATVRAGANGAEITTNPGSGAMSAVLALGEQARAPQPLALRVTAQVSQGTFQLVSTHRNWAADYHPFILNIPAGDTASVIVPIDQGGDPVLFISNGAAGVSRGRIVSVELIAPAQ